MTTETTEQAQARMLSALPAFPKFGYYVKTGLAGYGPDLDETDEPAGSWENLASDIASELEHMADFNDEGANAIAEQAKERYGSSDEVTNQAQAGAMYHEAWQALTLSRELYALAQEFSSLANAKNPAPLYANRPDLRHARIWNLISENFALDVSHNSRLYVWECPAETCEECGNDIPDSAVNVSRAHAESCSLYGPNVTDI